LIKENCIRNKLTEKTMPGRFIVFEGGEGSGKTTQIQQASQWLQESGWLARLQKLGLIQELVVTREPGGTELGKAIRQLLLDHTTTEPMQNQTELLLYAADRAQHVRGWLCPQLASSNLILCDRFTDSTIAYQGYGRGLDRSLIEQLNEIATQGLTSDLTLWLDLEVEIGLARAHQRGGHDRMEQADLEFHQRVRQGFQALALDNPERIVRIDANGSVKDVSQQIQIILTQYLTAWYGAVNANE
jgi:dTMP kinase